MSMQLATRAFGVIDISEVQNKLDSIEQLESKLKAQQLELEKARELIRLQNDILCTVYTENSATVVKAKEFLKKEGE